MERASGILLPVFSLPSPYGMGDLGPCARAFVDFLAAAGQRYWQVLPIGPTSFGDSPYQSFSSYAGNPYMLSLEVLHKKGLLTASELRAARDTTRRIRYDQLYRERYPLLRKAYERARGADWGDFFAHEQRWLADYALFMACKSHFGGAPYWEWPADIRLREPAALERYRETLAEDIDFHIFLQAAFYEQWAALRDYAHAHGVRLLGDLPIYVSRDSAEVWADPACFQLAPDGTPTAVAGVPPDYFTADGQLWGNPLYDWDRMAQDGYAWWLGRVEANSRFFDALRIDHFRGFAAYWRVPFGAPTAREGAWVQGPGMGLIGALRARFPDYPIIAEDLGVLTDDVRALLRDSGYPGMKVLQFAFDPDGGSDYLPHRYAPHCVCYTGTHDNTTLKAWFREVAPASVAFARNYLGLNPWEGYCEGMLRAGMASVAELFIACMQDYLKTGAQSRINTPGTMGGNWCWRLKAGDLSPALARRIAAMTRRYGRT